MPFTADNELLTGLPLHRNVIQDAVLSAEQYVWIATANLKDMHIPSSHVYRPLLETFDHMAGRGVSFRIIHSALPSKPFHSKTGRALPISRVRHTLLRASEWYGGSG